MTSLRLLLLAAGLTALTIVFIDVNAEKQRRIFWHLLTVHDLPAAWLMLATLLLGHWLGGRGAAHWSWVERLLLDIDRQRYRIAVVLWLVLCAAARFIYRDHPLSMDEYAVVFQAKVFAAGAMHGQFPPALLDVLIPLGFQNNFLMVNRLTGAVFSGYWPGFSLLLTPFMLLGVPWACNPTLVAASWLLLGRLTRDVAGAPLAAGWAMLFALASPELVATGVSYYSMPAHLLANLGFAWLLLSPSPRRSLFAGLVGGFALVLHNPFSHVVFALPWMAWLLLRRERRWSDLAWLALGYLLVVLFLGLGWWSWQQHTLRAGATLAASAGAPISDSGAHDWLLRVLGLLRGFLRVLQWPDTAILLARLGGLSKIWLWASPLLLLLAWCGWRAEKSARVRLLGASAVLTFAGYFLVRFDQGHGWGYRYFHSAWGVLPVLGALGAVALVAAGSGRTAQRLAVTALLSLLTANGLRALQMNDFMVAHLAQFPPRLSASSLVLHDGRGYYALDLIQNDPWLRGPQRVFLVRSEADRALILSHFPGSKAGGRNRFGESRYLETSPVALATDGSRAGE